MVKHTVQQILEQHLAEFQRNHNLPLHHIKALRQWLTCRTAALGGHAQYCENGHLNGVWYNSCKHRSCPQCQAKATEEWLLNTQRVLLDCPHHHVIFTLPSELHPLWLYNQEIMTNILFQATQDTLKQFAKDPKYLDAVPGMLCTLHTWGRSLPLHPHIHVLISHGGINGEGEWVEPRKAILFPQKPVMQVFRGKLRDLIKKAMNDDPDWVLPPDRREHHITALLNKLGRKEWVVHFCERYDHADGVAKYLSRYVKSGPLKNSQIIAVTDTHVSFRYKSHETKRMEVLKLTVDAFIQRLLMHVPVPGKPTVRYSGLYHGSARKKLNQAREALGQQAVSERQMLKWQDYLESLGDRPVCETCGLPLIRQEAVDRPKKVA